MGGGRGGMAEAPWRLGTGVFKSEKRTGKEATLGGVMSAVPRKGCARPGGVPSRGVPLSQPRGPTLAGDRGGREVSVLWGTPYAGKVGPPWGAWAAPKEGLTPGAMDGVVEKGDLGLDRAAKRNGSCTRQGPPPGPPTTLPPIAAPPLRHKCLLPLVTLVIVSTVVHPRDAQDASTAPSRPRTRLRGRCDDCRTGHTYTNFMPTRPSNNFRHLRHLPSGGR